MGTGDIDVRALIAVEEVTREERRNEERRIAKIGEWTTTPGTTDGSRHKRPKHFTAPPHLEDGVGTALLTGQGQSDLLRTCVISAVKRVIGLGSAKVVTVAMNVEALNTSKKIVLI